MVKLSELNLKTVKPDGDDTVDCPECKFPIGKFEEIYITKEDQTYMICPQCGEIYKVKD
jgi:uncharacterized protein YbaR (Trm112 family)